MSCRSTVITLLPKKGDQQDLKNWRPVSLLCTDHKTLSKVLALRLREVMLSIIHPDHAYCVPNRFISDNVTLIRDILELSSSSATQTGHISIDQEKAFDQVEHQYLWQTLAAFGFNSVFTAMLVSAAPHRKIPLKELKVGWRSGVGFSQRCPLEDASGRTLYKMLVETMNRHRLNLWPSSRLQAPVEGAVQAATL
ncbi:Transposon TX1 uncharacterized 149 kDa protein ORF 2 [Takifugu flavidus]|uniref:Transposon TX1 uncharacterized 149 kDa protein ORF 2 n=1 Tax=Takifugu flavidus TaxID=433684 RepID=A0A5C6NWF7_9TELE|nr:Transposon TX1 uncharacterized 149 kDa protein ORF 2 [Takifugu flavidus]